MHRNDFNSNINISPPVEKSMLYMKIVLNRKILSKLYFNCHAFFYKIYLIIGAICFKATCNNRLLLFIFI